MGRGPAKSLDERLAETTAKLAATMAKKEQILKTIAKTDRTRRQAEVWALGEVTRQAWDGNEALRVLGTERIDVAVLDVMMENPDAGFVLCHHLRKHDATIPVILVTSVNSDTGMDFDMVTEEDRQWIKADALLSKPIRFEQLLGEINRLLAAKK